MQKNKILRRLTAFLLSAVFLFTGVAQTFAWNPNDVGRILRTFKIKKNVEVTDNGKIII